METREFAQRVLFSSSLAEKLTPGGLLSDEDPGEALGTPGEPGRPVDLRLRKDGVRADFPGESKLVNEEQRGILLHFFANHELLATELMALVLLKFPGAPPEFRRGLIHTLEEEQQHTKWYLRRMEECGIQFGDFPLNRFFWDSIAPMDSPLDYVTRLSLTFEQANLDYAWHYAGILQEAGDAKTAKILSRVYRDEIGHVGYGLKWFRRWKAAGDSDWDAYRRRLPFPLSPARGRGNVPFNAEGHRNAGLDDSFIREMELFSRSKGRTPNLFWFTPDSEAAMAHGLEGRGFLPREEVQVLGRDLEILPAFLCHRDDVVLMRQPPSAPHRHKLLDLGFEVPEFEALDDDGKISSDSLLRTRKLNDFRPWAWAPQSAALFASLGREKTSLPWNADIRQLFAKDWQVEALAEPGSDRKGSNSSETLDDKMDVRHEANDRAEWGGRANLPVSRRVDRGSAGASPSREIHTPGPFWSDSVVCRTPEDVVEAARILCDRGFAEAVAKSPFGAAGQKNKKFLSASPQDLQPWLGRVIDQQGGVVVEPWLPRVFDFSVQYEMGDAGLKRLGFVQLENDRRGQFQACVASGKFSRGLSPEITRFLMNGALAIYDKSIPERLEPLLRAAGYCGPVGIDAFVFRLPDGGLQLRPMVEMNPRFTMGRLTWELMRRVTPGRSVRFELLRTPDPQAKTKALEAANPPTIGRSGKLSSGCVVLNEPQSVLAVLTVGGASNSPTE